MSELAHLLDDPKASRTQVTDLLAGREAADERKLVLGLGKHRQSRLWDVAGSDPLPIEIEFFVPASAPAYQPFPFDGRNSLPAFTEFQKVFYRTSTGEIGGLNNQLLMRVTGPGYYIAEVQRDREGEVAVDYRKTPSSKPRGWPRIVPNTRFPSKLIYGGTVDYLRRISDRAAIGRAYRDGTDEMPNWFVLVRGRELDGLFGFDYWRPRRQRAR